jgi:hypothetical protein
MSKEKLDIHMKTFETLDWSKLLKYKSLESPSDILKTEIEFLLCHVLFRHHRKLSSTSPTLDVRNDQEEERITPSVLKAFETCDSAIQLDDGGTITTVEPMRLSHPQKPGQRSAWTKFRDEKIEVLTASLKGSPLYSVMILTDEACAIDVDSSFSSTDRARHRSNFRIEISRGLRGIAFCIFSKKNGHKLSFIALFKIPISGRRDAIKHAGSVLKAVEEARKEMPQFVNRRELKEFNSMLYNIAKVNKNTSTSIFQYLTGAPASHYNEQQSKAMETIIKAAAGEPLSEELFMDMRSSNSRGGRGLGATNFEFFWEKCREIMQTTSAAHERRGSDTLFASQVMSLRDLQNRAMELLQTDIENRKHDAMPPIPALEWIRLQFSSNNEYCQAAAKMTGRLNIKRGIQTRTSRKEHPDQHWVNASTGYYLDWSIELKKKGVEIMFVGQDDKAKIPVGHDVAVSTGVRKKGRAILAVESEGRLKAADHDFTFANIVASVTLYCNIPDSLSGSFFGGGEEGTGEIEVVCRDAVFDGSDVFKHTGQLWQSIQDRPSKPAVVLIQTDGGPDHCLKFLRSQLALIALFKIGNFDHVVAIRGAPGGSALNKCEHGASSILD